jgi:hypothetical protein
MSKEFETFWREENENELFEEDIRYEEEEEDE